MSVSSINNNLSPQTKILNNDALEHVFSFLNLEEQANARRVSTQFRNVIDHGASRHRRRKALDLPDSIKNDEATFLNYLERVKQEAHKPRVTEEEIVEYYKKLKNSSLPDSIKDDPSIYLRYAELLKQHKGKNRVTQQELCDYWSQLKRNQGFRMHYYPNPWGIEHFPSIELRLFVEKHANFPLHINWNVVCENDVRSKRELDLMIQHHPDCISFKKAKKIAGEWEAFKAANTQTKIKHAIIRLTPVIIVTVIIAIIIFGIGSGCFAGYTYRSANRVKKIIHVPFLALDFKKPISSFKLPTLSLRKYPLSRWVYNLTSLEKRKVCIGLILSFLSNLGLVATSISGVFMSIFISDFPHNPPLHSKTLNFDESV